MDGVAPPTKDRLYILNCTIVVPDDELQYWTVPQQLNGAGGTGAGGNPVTDVAPVAFKINSDPLVPTSFLSPSFGVHVLRPSAQSADNSSSSGTDGSTVSGTTGSTGSGTGSSTGSDGYGNGTASDGYGNSSSPLLNLIAASQVFLPSGRVASPGSVLVIDVLQSPVPAWSMADSEVIGQGDVADQLAFPTRVASTGGRSCGLARQLTNPPTNQLLFQLTVNRFQPQA